MVATLIPFDESLSDWERALYAFLAEKERRSGSRRTVEGYSRMLQHFFGAVGKPPERVTSPEVFRLNLRLTRTSRGPQGSRSPEVKQAKRANTLGPAATEAGPRRRAERRLRRLSYPQHGPRPAQPRDMIT